MDMTGLCRHLRNWFVCDEHTGTFSVVGGDLLLPFLKDGQYFRIIGSVFNDGVYKYPAVGLTDEEFTGAVWSMVVPSDVIVLLDDINAWEVKYREASESPYESESFGGYTYSKASGNGESGAPVSWQTVFRSRLNEWRKL
jgi:hypothetical protein